MRFTRPPKRATGRMRPTFSSGWESASMATAACAEAGGRRRLDAYGVFGVFPPGDKYAIAFGNDIIQSIPAGSIYFGGADPGRFVVTALMESHADGKPFFMLSQNPLADVTYLHYLRAMYGGKIYTPTDEDLQKSFQDYTDGCAAPSCSRPAISQRAQTTQARRGSQAGFKRTNPN